MKSSKMRWAKNAAWMGKTRNANPISAEKYEEKRT
jgi:hypothetical protein